jgi:organic radical activating enzyme
VKHSAILPAWGRVLRGFKPLLAIEITKECPLHCPGCYAYEPEHLGGGRRLAQLADFRGERLVEQVLALVRRHRPIHLSIVGGEPLVRYRELDVLLPELGRMGVEVQLVTSAVRPIPAHWAALECLHLVVSVDGLPPEHNRRRAPATYDRILRHIQGHQIIVHCTVTRQMAGRNGYLDEFVRFWSARAEVRKLWFSLFTPQEGQYPEERLTAEDRRSVLEELGKIAARHPKVHLPRAVLDGLASPPSSPAECLFAQLTECLSADLATRITPCQFGGRPVCAECGCLASAGLASIGRYKLGGLIPVSEVLALSQKFAAALTGRSRTAA